MKTFDLYQLNHLPIPQLRKELFDTVGFCILRNFCSVSDTEVIRRFWHRNANLPYGHKGYWVHRADYAMQSPSILNSTPEQRYECFFWNAPIHELTYNISWLAHVVRNLVSGLPPHTQMLPFDDYAVTYRPTRSDVGAKPIARHVDQRDPTEDLVIQISLTLSTPHKDYSGAGTVIKMVDGNRVNIHNEYDVSAGDLILFNQALEHEVPEMVQSDPENPLSGHWRILLPSHPIVAQEQEWVPGTIAIGEKRPKAPIRAN